jgi:hypothetical protein
MTAKGAIEDTKVGNQEALASIARTIQKPF